MKEARLVTALGRAESALRAALQIYEKKLLALPAEQRPDSTPAHEYDACLRAATIVSFLKQAEDEGQLRLDLRTDTQPPEVPHVEK
jgi:hypothetical protein